ncbi:MAG TPA: type II CAAX endopeptidase family protein [Anaerolineae bacterium]|nr:type II CAAX endopeptidase family protein [Anaerolineae bacterium]HUW94849.1 type II CAAX endopeptidase family protein [Anaerolineae bacterium]
MDKKSDLRAAIILISSTLLLIIRHYHTVLGDETISSFVFYCLIPLGIIIFILREDPRDFGLRVGNWRKGALFSLLGIALMGVVIVGLAQVTEFQQYYGLTAFREPDSRGLTELALRMGVYMFSWEFMFRGFLLFGLKDRLGPLAIWIQAIPFAIMHLGKPELETLSTIFGGAAFGYVDLESRSVLPSVLIHWAIYLMMVLAASSV